MPRRTTNETTPTLLVKIIIEDMIKIVTNRLHEQLNFEDKHGFFWNIVAISFRYFYLSKLKSKVKSVKRLKSCKQE